MTARSARLGTSSLFSSSSLVMGLVLFFWNHSSIALRS